jgi:phosphoserine phosphatase RsbU/P
VNVVLQSIIGSAAATTGAEAGWIVVPRDGQLEVVAALGSTDLMGATVAADAGTAAYVLASGQPVAMVPRADDAQAAEGVAALLGTRPGSVLCVPCAHDDDVLGVIELVDKAGGGPFSFDDVELVTVLAGIAGAALRDRDPGVDVRSADELGAELRQLAGADPAAYVRVATVVEALLARG